MVEVIVDDSEMYGALVTAQYARLHHRHHCRENQCTSVLVKYIKAPVHLVSASNLFLLSRSSSCVLVVTNGGTSTQVWSLVRRFDEPQKYKPFVSRCTVHGHPEIGSLREVNVKSGLPATTSTERLEQLDDNERILGINIIGGDHRLKVYKIS